LKAGYCDVNYGFCRVLGQRRRNGRVVVPEGGWQAGSRAEEAAGLCDENRTSSAVLSWDWSAEGISRQHDQRNVAGDQELRVTIAEL